MKAEPHRLILRKLTANLELKCSGDSVKNCSNMKINTVSRLFYLHRIQDLKPKIRHDFNLYLQAGKKIEFRVIKYLLIVEHQRESCLRLNSHRCDHSSHVLYYSAGV